MEIKHATSENFDELIKSGKVLVDFYADWCGPCQMLAPVLESVAEENKDLTIVKVNTDENMELAMKYAVMSIPKIVLFKDGKKIKSDVGYKDKSEVEEFISE